MRHISHDINRGNSQLCLSLNKRPLYILNEIFLYWPIGQFKNTHFADKGSVS